MADQGTRERKHVQFSVEDRARITRLQEEITGRIEEIARIHVRNLEITPQFPVKEFTFKPRNGTAAAPEPVAGEVQITYSDGSQSCCMNPPGVCCSGPCPC